VTGLASRPASERVASLGVIYVSSAGSRRGNLYGWAHDRVLQLTADSLQASGASPRARCVDPVHKVDGFYVLFDLRTRPDNGRRPRLEDEARRFRTASSAPRRAWAAPRWTS
jgi:hypothetical protein